MNKTKYVSNKRNAWNHSLQAMITQLISMQQRQFCIPVSDIIEYDEETYDKMMIKKGRLTYRKERMLMSEALSPLQELLKNWSENTKELTALMEEKQNE
jgi:hypothetical protein